MTNNGWHGSDDLAETLVRIEDLILLPGNPRHGDVGAISQSLERFGQRSPIKINEDNIVLGGNHTLLAAQALGWTDIAVTVASGLEGAEQSAYALADNRLSDLATYDNELLYDMAMHVESETGDLTGTGYDMEDLEDMDRELSPLSNAGNLVPPDSSDIQLGDEFELGDHLLICGDATNKTYARPHELMFADPPYNVDIGYGKATNDTRDDYHEWTESWWKAMGSERAVITVGWVNLSMAYNIWEVSHTGVWLKRNAGSASPVSMFSYWEPLLFLGAGFKTQPLRSDDIFTFPITPSSSDGDHPVPKPLALIMDLLENYTNPGDTVFDPFGGSGTTMIAAQMTGRKCVMLELEPGYCAGIIERFNKEFDAV
jgi:DNA modification methylase